MGGEGGAIRLPSKYRNVKTEVDGITFQSKAEARHYEHNLKLRLVAGEIENLELQPRYPIVVNGVKICTYVADFRYDDGGRVVVEDVKGARTGLFVMKKRLMKAVYGIDVREVES